MQSKTRYGAARFLTALATLALLVGLVPSASAVPSTGFDNFDSYTAGLIAGNNDGSGNGPFYTASGNELVVTTPAGHSSANSVIHHGTITPTDNFCTTASPLGTTTLDFWWQIPTLPTGTAIWIGVGPAAGGFGSGSGAIGGNLHGVGIGIDASGGSAPFTDGVVSGPGFPTTIAVNTWYHTTFSSMNCDGTGSFVATLNGVGSSVASGTFATLKPFSERTSGGSFWNVYIDDLTIRRTNAATGSVFCGNVFDTGGGADQGGGYEYNNGVDEVLGGDTSDISFDDFFKFVGTSSGTDTLSKHFTTGTTAFHVITRMEANGGGTSSVFRVAFTYDNSAVPTTTLRGNGIDTQMFTESLSAQFTETGNSWQVQFYLVHSGTRTPLGAAFQYGSPNGPLVFSFWADTGATATIPSTMTFGTTGGTSSTGPYVAMTVPSGGTPADQIVAYRSLKVAGSQALSDAMKGKLAYDQWYLGYGTGAFLGAETGVDSTGSDSSGNIATTDSTCIFDDAGGAVVGAGGSGITPSSQIPSFSSTGSSTGGLGGLGGSPGFPGVDIDSLASASGMSAGAFGGFAAILFMLILATTMGSFGALMSKNSNVPIVMGGIGAVGGFGLDMFFGLIPLWLAALLGVAAIGLFIFLRGR